MRVPGAAAIQMMSFNSFTFAYAGAADLSELKAHPFFSSIDWAGLRAGPAPAFVVKPRRPAEEEALDWELTSLVQAAAGAAYHLGEPTQ